VSTVNDELRRCLARLGQTAAALGQLAQSAGDDLPGLLLARLLLDVDVAASKLAQHAEALATLRQERANFPP
jgi:hypothetical protein